MDDQKPIKVWAGENQLNKKTIQALKVLGVEKLQDLAFMTAENLRRVLKKLNTISRNKLVMALGKREWKAANVGNSTSQLPTGVIVSAPGTSGQPMQQGETLFMFIRSCH